MQCLNSVFLTLSIRVTMISLRPLLLTSEICRAAYEHSSTLRSTGIAHVKVGEETGKSAESVLTTGVFHKGFLHPTLLADLVGLGAQQIGATGLSRPGCQVSCRRPSTLDNTTHTTGTGLNGAWRCCGVVGTATDSAQGRSC